MRRPWVKVCGVTTVADALMIADLSVEAIGLNFVAESPRRVTVDLAREIAAALPGAVLKVGIFRNAPEEEVDRIAGIVGLDRLQLHGDEDPAYCGRRSVPVWKALAIGPGCDDAQAESWRLLPLLVYGYHPRLAGGTGNVADWPAARRLVDRGHVVILAGGLSAKNLAEAVRAVDPAGVDLNSGVEHAPGHKDRQKLIEALRALGRKV